MTSAIATPIVFPNSSAQAATFEEPESSASARNFARMMDRAVRAPGAKTRNAAARAPADAAWSDEEEDSDADEISKKQVSPDDRNATAALPPTWLAGLIVTGFSQPNPNPLTGSDGQQNAAARCSLDAGPAGEGCVLGAQPLLHPGDNSLSSSGTSSLAGSPSESAARQLHVKADDGNTTGVSHPDTLLGLAGQPGPTGLCPNTPGSMGEPSPPGRLAPDISLLSESMDPVPVFAQPGASQAEASKAGSGNAPTAVTSDSSPAVAVSPQASGEEKPSAHEQALITAVSEHGTSAAQHTGTMQATHEMNENAALAEQNLPALVAALEAAAPAGRERRARANAVDRIADLPAGAAEMAFALANHPAGHELSTYAAADAPQTVVVEGVRRAIENAAAGLRRIDASSLSLVLTPDANTQLSLHVKLQQGQFEVLAVLERGDLAALGAEWSQLQNRLAEQGVRLAPLVSGAEQGNGFSGNDSFSKQRDREKMPTGDLPIPAMAKTEARKSGGRTLAAANRREWWA